MAIENNKKSSVLAELRRRRLFRTAVAYVVSAWVLVQIADTILPIYDSPVWVLRAFVTLLVVGFTPAMIFTWLFNITGRRIEASGDPPPQARLLTSVWFRSAVGATTAVLTGIAIWWIWTDYLAASASGTAGENNLPTNPIVAVAPIRNLSRNAELDWLGEGLANLVRTDLARSRHVVVVSEPRWDSITRQAKTTEEAMAVAETAGIDFVFSGEFISAPAGLYLAVRLLDLKNGIEKGAESFSGMTPETLLGNAYRLSIVARKGLQIPHTESVDSFAADFVVNNMTAYEAYVGGLEYFRRFEYAEAEQAFTAALELAPSFYIARYRLAHVYMSTGRQSEAVETILAIPDDAPLSERERFYVDAAKAFFQFDLTTSIAMYKKLLEKYPYEVEARQFLAELYFQNYQEDIAVAELKILARQEPENEFIFGSMGTYLLLSGRLDEAEQPLLTYHGLAAEKAHPLTMLGDLYRQRSEYQKSSEYYAEALAANPKFAEARRGEAQVLTILGDTAAAKITWSDIVGDPSIAADERIYAAFDYASVLRSEGRFREAINTLLALESEIREERIREPLALATRALCHMDLGEVEHAHELVGLAIERNRENQASAPTRYLFTRGLLELQQHNFDAVATTAAEIRSHALPGDNPDRTEEKAATYLEGMALLDQDRPAEAVVQLRKALAFAGYDYAIYGLGMAVALWSANELPQALEFAQAAASYRNPAEVRLDLELDRVRALLWQARIQNRLGQRDAAKKLALRVLDKWREADQPNADADLARSLAGV